jgi:hypothetical protein
MAKRKNALAPDEEKALVTMNKMAVEKKENLAAAKTIIDGFGFRAQLGEEYSRLVYVQTGNNVFRMREGMGLVGGAILLELKEHEEHGSFMKAVEEMGLGHRSATRYMHYARKFGKLANLATLRNSKLDLLEDLDEAELKELNDKGEVFGINLDEIERLPAWATRDELRKAKEKLKRQEALHEKELKRRDEEIADLKFALGTQQPPTKEQIAIAELARLDEDYFHELTSAMAAMRKAADILNRAQCVPGANVQILSDWIGKYNDEMVLLNGVREEFIDLIDNLHPVTRGGYGAESDVPDLR